MTSFDDQPPDAYFAGFFDGEGSVTILTRNDHPTENYRLNINVPQVNREILERFKARFGGRINNSRKRDDWQQQWTWVTGGRSAEPFFNAVLPYVIVKRPQVVLGIEFCKLFHTQLPTGKSRDTVLSTEVRRNVMNARRHCHQQLRILNARGTRAASPETRDQITREFLAGTWRPADLGIPHGYMSRYQSGCRCPECRAANARATRQRNARLKLELELEAA